jgi:hypothetical protein
MLIVLIAYVPSLSKRDKMSNKCVKCKIDIPYGVRPVYKEEYIE